MVVEAEEVKEEEEEDELRSNLKSISEVEREFVRKLDSERHIGRGALDRHGSRGGQLSGAVVPVQPQLPMDGGMGTRV